MLIHHYYVMTFIDVPGGRGGVQRHLMLYVSLKEWCVGDLNVTGTVRHYIDLEYYRY